MTDMNEKIKETRRRFIAWIDCHPRVGWYIVALVTLNTILNLLDIALR